MREPLDGRRPTCCTRPANRVRETATRRTSVGLSRWIVCATALAFLAVDAGDPRRAQLRPPATTGTVEDLFGPTGNRFGGAIGFVTREANAAR